MAETLEYGEGRGGSGLLKGEIDTSAPFESVKEAVTMFGGLGFWKPLLPRDMKEVDAMKVEEQAAELEKELMLKERETLHVLKELEATKLMVEELRLKLQKEEVATNVNINPDEKTPFSKDEEKENNHNFFLQKLPKSSILGLSSSPGEVLLELKQAKWNLTKTTNDLAEIRASVELYNKKIEQEKTSLEKTRERLRSSTSKISSLEEEISQTKSKLQDSTRGEKDIMVELQRLNAEAEKYREIGMGAKSEVMNVMLQIEQTKAKIKTAEIRLVAARKMKEAARAAESVALSEIKALEKSKKISLSGALEGNSENITLTFQEYSSLKSEARDAEQFSNQKILQAMLEVDEANMSKSEIMKKVGNAMEEVKTSKRALEEALDRVETANNAKLDVEKVLRKWRSENGERRRLIQNNTKFKNLYPSNRRRDSWMFDLNGVNLVREEIAPALRPTLSIGEILSRKLLITEKFGSGKRSGKQRKVSLGQMFGIQNSELSRAWKVEKEDGNPKRVPLKRKEFGFARFSVLLPKKSQKKKKP